MDKKDKNVHSLIVTGVTLGIPVNNGSSRSMSNLHSAHRMLSPPQRNAPATGGRRRWNVPVNGGTPPHPPVDGNDVAQSQSFEINFSDLSVKTNNF